MVHYTLNPNIPYGYCQCGCGQLTNIADHNEASRLLAKGEPYRFIAGHSQRLPKLNFYDRFWSKVAITADDNLCWLWTASLNQNGYGQINLNHRPIVASRIAWMYPNYVIPEGMEICHSCDNPKCCNPKHLFLGTHTDNMRDMQAKGRDNKPKGETHTKAKLSDRQVIEIRKRYASGGITQRELANEYGVGHSTIGHITSIRSWKHLTLAGSE